ncbi:hypothetical protein CEXT_289791 [Caerostris extrusa]|uniref:Transposase n=1 Tax=Caerostris extrusa TaxID=172846 RepID=A0AAV4N961_CAEEX|nr:hypothetical protein CEXT_289791 [Caerostris extrusa]
MNKCNFCSYETSNSTCFRRHLSVKAYWRETISVFCLLNAIFIERKFTNPSSNTLWIEAIQVQYLWKVFQAESPSCDSFCCAFKNAYDTIKSNKEALEGLDKSIECVINDNDELQKEIKDWKHSRGRDNPAKRLTRGITIKDLENDELWWFGSSWLFKDYEVWPKKKEVKVTVDETFLKEERKGNVAPQNLCP